MYLNLDIPLEPNPTHSNAFKKKWFWSKSPKWQELPDREIYSNVPDYTVSNNTIMTSKYNVLTFVPKNLMEQFSKPANVYFLVTPYNLPTIC